MTAGDHFVFRVDSFFQATNFLKRNEKKTDQKPKSPVNMKLFSHTFLEEVKILCTEKDRPEKKLNNPKFFGKVRLSKIRKRYQAKSFFRMIFYKSLFLLKSH